MLIGAIVAVVAVTVMPLPGLFAFHRPVALFGFVILCFVLMRQHDVGCARCACCRCH